MWLLRLTLCILGYRISKMRPLENGGYLMTVDPIRGAF